MADNMNAGLSELNPPPRPPDIRRFAGLLAAAGTLFWLYTFYAIAHVPLGDGTGLQWLAVFPLAGIFGLFFIPAWILVAIRRLLRVAAILGITGLIAFGFVWLQLLAEFPKH